MRFEMGLIMYMRTLSIKIHAAKIKIIKVIQYMANDMELMFEHVLYSRFFRVPHIGGIL